MKQSRKFFKLKKRENSNWKMYFFYLDCRMFGIEYKVYDAMRILVKLD